MHALFLKMMIAVEYVRKWNMMHDEDGEQWVHCEGKCQRRFHLKCLKVKRLPKGTWRCATC